MVGGLKKIGAIEIVRNTTTKENLNFFDKIKKSIEKSNRPLLIFPQGTRVGYKDRVPFKKESVKFMMYFKDALYTCWIKYWKGMA